MVDAIDTSKAATSATVNSNSDAAARQPKVLRDVKTSQTKSPKGASLVKRMPIGDGETASSKIEIVDDNVVKANYTFKLDANSKQRYGISTLFDYNGTSRAELLEVATRSHVITLQRKLREMGDGALDASIFARVHVKSEITEASRAAVDGPTRDLYAFMRATNISDPETARKWLALIADGTVTLPK